MSGYIRIDDACAEVDKGDLLVGDNALWAKEIICRTAQADVKEVVRSTWRLYKDGSAVCNHCHRTTMYAYDHESWMSYCPNCGSRMIDIEVNTYA